MEVRLLGEPSAVRAGVPVVLGGRRRGAVLAVLALRAPRSVSRFELVEAVWGDDPPASAVNAVQVHVSALRKALGADAIETVGDGYRLGGGVATDVAAFDAAVLESTDQLARGQPAAAAERLHRALGLWRGPPLAGLEDAPFAGPEVQRLLEARLRAIEQRIEADLAVGRHREVIGELGALVTQHPLREGLRGLLMRALYRSGRQADALAVFDQARRVLRDELGVDPSPALRELHQQLLNQTDDHTPVAGEVPLVRAAPLPALLDATVGRDADLDAVQALVRDPSVRLVSVVGPGGVGKTRVATELAHRAAGRFRDSAVFVPLAQAERHDDVAALLCAALGVPARGSAAETLAAALTARELLIVLDNFEHVLDAVGLLPDLLGAAPGVTLLVTSRQVLGIRGERVWHLDPLQAATGQSAAVQLFVDRARATNPTWTPGEHDLTDIATICTRCEGLPLAIELAAARTRALTIAELRDRLESPLPFLDRGSRDLPDRQRSLRASIAHSVDALDPIDARFLAELTVFRGGFALPAAQAVAGLDPDETLARVERLIDRSLLRTIDQPPNLPRRFGLLETIREYAADTLTPDDTDRRQRRHADYLRDLLDPPPYPAWIPHTARAWRAQLVERPNLRQAARWALDHDEHGLAADLLAGLAAMWHDQGPMDELARWLRQLIESDVLPSGRRCDLLFWLSIVCNAQGEHDARVRALHTATVSARTSGEPERIAVVLMQSALWAALDGDTDTAEATFADTQARADLSETRNDYLRIHVLNTRGAIDYCKRALHAAADAFEQGLALSQRHEYDQLSLMLANNLIETHLLRGDAARTLALTEHQVSFARRFDTPIILATATAQRGYAHFLCGDTAKARRDLHHAINAQLTYGHLYWALEHLLRLAAVTSDESPESAALAVGVFEAASIGQRSEPTHRDAREHLARLPDDLGDRYDAAVREGREAVAARGTARAIHWLLDRITDGSPDADPTEGR